MSFGIGLLSLVLLIISIMVFGTVKVNFNLRIEKDTPKDKLVPIKAVIRFNNQTVALTKVAEIEPKWWNAEKQQPRRSTSNPNGNSVDRKLSDVRNTITRLFENYVTENKALPDPKEFQKLCRAEIIMPKRANESPDINKTSDDFISYIMQYVSQARAGIRTHGIQAKPFSKRSISTFANTANYLDMYRLKYGMDRLPFNSIDQIFYYQFRDLMYSKGYSNNYFGVQIRNVKKFMSAALREGYHSNRKFQDQDFIKVAVESDNVYLTTEQLDQILSLDLSSDLKLQNARDLFLIGCWTGLRFSDFSRLTRNHFDGEFIDIETQKTGEVVAIPVHPVVKSIILRYELTPSGMPKSISNQKLNDYIKEVCQLAGLTHKVSQTKLIAGKKEVIKEPFYKLVSSHTARRSFASNAIRIGVPETVIRAITGHKSESAFRKYVKISPREKAQIMAEIWNRQSLKVVNGGAE